MSMSVSPDATILQLHYIIAFVQTFYAHLMKMYSYIYTYPTRCFVINIQCSMRAYYNLKRRGDFLKNSIIGRQSTNNII